MTNSNIKKAPTSLRILELIIWPAITIVTSWRILYAVGNGYWDYILNHYFEFLFGLFILLFPFLFRLIFGLYPFEYIRRMRKLKGTIEYRASKNEKNNNFNDGNFETVPSEILLNEGDTELNTLLGYLKQSQLIAEKIYNRSGVYLLIGCLIAFAGVLFFYFQTASLHKISSDPSKPLDFTRTILLEYLPRLGTLIFVEAIAFFFLRQYRATLEEFRYYEAIKRQRENQVAIVKIVKSYTDKDDLLNKIIDKCAFNENPNKLGQNETTQLLEAVKITSQETDLIDKLTEIIKVAKK